MQTKDQAHKKFNLKHFYCKLNIDQDHMHDLFFIGNAQFHVLFSV